MTGIKVSFKSEYKSQKPQRERELINKLQQGMHKAVLIVERQAKINATPFVDTGRLRASITSEVRGDEGLVGTNVEYAPDVEFGTTRRPATPFLFPALEKSKDKIREALSKG